MAISGMAICVRSVTTRQVAPFMMPMPPPMVMPSAQQSIGLG